MILELLFWANLVVILYVFFGYPALLWVLSRPVARQRVPVKEEFEPTVSVIIPAHNEERTIANKLETSLTLDYPKDKLEIIVASDGSTDKTADIVRGYADKGVTLVELPLSLGKASAQNEAVKQATKEIMLFTDANVSLQRDALRRLVERFRDTRVGCVVGRVTYFNEDETGVSQGEGFYWKYELFLRYKESYLGNLVAGSGPIIAVRRSLFEPLDPAISEDFFLPMRAAIKGYQTVYEPRAISRERLFQVTARDMLRTRIRTTTLDTRSILLCSALLNPFRYPLYAWGLISHKLLRWLVPYFLIVLFATNVILLDHPFYQLIMLLQIAFYLLSLTGYLWERKGKSPWFMGIPFSFCLSHLAVFIGVARFIMGKSSGQWVPVRQD